MDSKKYVVTVNVPLTAYASRESALEEALDTAEQEIVKETNDALRPLVKYVNDTLREEDNEWDEYYRRIVWTGEAVVEASSPEEAAEKVAAFVNDNVEDELDEDELDEITVETPHEAALRKLAAAQRRAERIIQEAQKNVEMEALKQEVQSGQILDGIPDGESVTMTPTFASTRLYGQGILDRPFITGTTGEGRVTVIFGHRCELRLDGNPGLRTPQQILDAVVAGTPITLTGSSRRTQSSHPMPIVTIAADTPMAVSS